MLQKSMIKISSKKILVGSVLLAGLTTGAFAHFQMLYTPDTALNKGETIELREVFTHPFADEHTMDMGKQHDSQELKPVEEFYVINKGKKTDLKSTLKGITFTGQHNSGKAYASQYKAQRMGDHILILQPAPYYEANEDAYIQQITKSIINVAGTPTDWDSDLGLKAEIVPLTKPYAIWEGGSFTGVVKSKGKPVPYAEIEVEYLNRDIDMKNNKTGKSYVEAPQDAFVTMGIKTDKDGEFTFTLPRAGFWGFAALGVGSDKTYKGKELSQDAVIWVEAKPMR
jgi:cobalt/nickel transport protein